VGYVRPANPWFWERTRVAGLLALLSPARLRPDPPDVLLLLLPGGVRCGHEPAFWYPPGTRERDGSGGKCRSCSGFTMARLGLEPRTDGL
jgi:hypothetical protein